MWDARGSSIGRLHLDELRYWHGLLLVLVVVGFIARVWHADSMALWIDEAISARAAQGILLRGVPSVNRFGEGFYLYGRGPLHSYLVAASYALFGVSTLSARLPGIVFGTLAIPAIYLLGVATANERVGFYGAALATVHPWMIATSRYFRFYAVFQTLFVLALLAYVGWLRASKSATKQPLSLGDLGEAAPTSGGSRWTYGAMLAVSLLALYLTHRFYLLVVGLVVAYSVYHVVVTGRIRPFLTSRAAFGALLLPVLVLIAIVAGLVPPAVFELMAPSSYAGVDASWVVDYFRRHEPVLLALAVAGIVLQTARIVLTSARPHTELLVFVFAGLVLALSFAVPAVVGDTVPRYLSPLLPFVFLTAATAIDNVVGVVLRLAGLLVPTNRSLPGSLDVNLAVSAVIAAVILVGSVSAATPHFASDGYQAEFEYGSRVQAHDLRGPSEYILEHASGDVTVYIYPLNTPTFYLDWERGGVTTIRSLTTPENTGGSRWADPAYAIGDSDELRQRVRTDAERGEVWFVVKNWRQSDRAGWVRARSARIEGPWKAAQLYRYRGSDIELLSPREEGWEATVVSADGNVFGTPRHIALGRRMATNVTWGEQTEAQQGELVLRVENRWEAPVLSTRVYGHDHDRYVRIYYSTDGETWTKLIDHDDGRWQRFSIPLEEVDPGDGVIYLRIVGGSSADTSTGGLVNYLRLEPAGLGEDDG